MTVRFITTVCRVQVLTDPVLSVFQMLLSDGGTGLFDYVTPIVVNTHGVVHTIYTDMEYVANITSYVSDYISDLRSDIAVLSNGADVEDARKELLDTCQDAKKDPPPKPPLPDPCLHLLARTSPAIKAIAFPLSYAMLYLDTKQGAMPPLSPALLCHVLPWRRRSFACGDTLCLSDLCLHASLGC